MLRNFQKLGKSHGLGADLLGSKVGSYIKKCTLF